MGKARVTFVVMLAVGCAGLAQSDAASAATCEGMATTAPSQSTNTKLVGTAGPDVLVARPGQRVSGLGGADTICGSGGFDVLDGGPGPDRLHGFGADDVLIGGPGVDYLDGGAGFDTVDADSNPETCHDVEYEPDHHCTETGTKDARLPAPEQPTSVPCDYWADTTGDDSAPGSFAAPYRTVERLVNTLRPGETGCLKPGVYTEADDQINVRGHGEPGKPITLESQPDARTATIRGRLWICANVPGVSCSADPGGAHDIVFAHLKLDGDNTLAYQRAAALGEPTAALPSPTINGDRIEFEEDEVTTDNRSTCFQVGSFGYGIANATQILDSDIHNCGERNVFRRQGKGDQAIGIETARGTEVRNNTLSDPTADHKSDMGVLVSADAQGSTIERNTIEGFGRAAVFYASPQGHLKDNLLTRNIITRSNLSYPDDGGSEHWQVEGQVSGSYPPPTGNRVTDNCFVFADKAHNVESPSPTFSVGPNLQKLPGARCPDGYGAVSFARIIRPDAGRNVLVEKRVGEVRVKKAGSRARRPLPLLSPAKVPVDSLVAARHGKALVVGAARHRGTRAGTFAGDPVKVIGAGTSFTRLLLLGPAPSAAHKDLHASLSGINRCNRHPTSRCCRHWPSLKRCGSRRRCARVAADTPLRFEIRTQSLVARPRRRSKFAVGESDLQSSVTVEKGSVEVRDLSSGAKVELGPGDTYPSH